MLVLLLALVSLSRRAVRNISDSTVHMDPPPLQPSKFLPRHTNPRSPVKIKQKQTNVTSCKTAAARTSGVPAPQHPPASPKRRFVAKFGSFFSSVGKKSGPRLHSVQTGLAQDGGLKFRHNVQGDDLPARRHRLGAEKLQAFLKSKTTATATTKKTRASSLAPGGRRAGAQRP